VALLHIGICDSNATQREQLHKILMMLLFDTTELKISHYPTGKALIDTMSGNGSKPDLLFLGVALPDICGLRVAAALRKASVRLDIIFLTELERYVYDGYVYHAYDYLIKPISAKKIGISIRRYVSEHFSNTDRYLSITSKGMVERLELSRIRYFESRERKVAAILDDREVEFYYKMGDLFEVIQKDGFWRCHQSYVINGNFVACLHNHEVILVDGTALPVSKRYLSEIKSQLSKSSLQRGAII